MSPKLLGRSGIGAILSESIEATLAARRGYSLLHWLSPVTGSTINDAAARDHLLYDLRRTIADQ